MRILRFKEFLSESQKNNHQDRLVENTNYDDNIGLINEGGAYGHLSHPFDNRDLTFADLEEMINITINSAFTADNFVQEKTDGQNLLFTWKDGELRAARNGGHLKNAGQNSLRKDEVKAKFADRGDISVAFSSAVIELENAIKALSPEQRDKIFAEGKKFMSVEVMYPKTQNVVPYGLSMLVFHGTNEYDESGNLLKIDKTEATTLAKMIKDVNADVQKTFFIREPLDLKLEKMPDTSKKEGYYKGKLAAILKNSGGQKSQTISEYLTWHWTNRVKELFPEIESNESISKLVLRFGHGQKGAYKVSDMKKDLGNDMTLNVQAFEKGQLKAEIKKAIQPLENLFLELGADVLTNVTSFLAANPKESSEQMRAQLEKTIKDIKATENTEAIAKLERELKRIESAGGLKRLVPSEGITFMYKGIMYKYTGLFAALNQINGLIHFAR